MLFIGNLKADISYSQKVKDLVQKYHYTDRVQFIDEISQAQLAKYYSNSGKEVNE